MSWTKWLGFQTGNDPWECVVTYSDGSTGYFAIWAKDLQDAMVQVSNAVPVRDNTAIRAEFKRREVPK